MDLQAILFNQDCPTVLPSPPDSPSRYPYSPAFGGSGWYTTRMASRHVLPAPHSNAISRPAESARDACEEQSSATQPRENPSRDRRTSPHSWSPHQITTAESSGWVSSDIKASGLTSPDQVSHQLQGEAPLKQRSTRASSTISQFTPQLVLTEAEYRSESDELFTGSEEEEDATFMTAPVISGAERLAEKRKMKRFRLTHAQTRYLTSEFSRQPHPDAAQRERLARDIPGLNPRQVQVWFQNRRAKLKRLTTDDQERMRNSRALPEDFDFSQALQPTLREFRPLYGSALTNPLSYVGAMCQRPNLQLGMSHLNTASNSMNLALAKHAPSPVSAKGSSNPSPVSSVNEGSEPPGQHFSATQSPLVTSPQSANSFGRSHSMSVDSFPFQRQDQPSSQNNKTGLGGQPVTTTSLSHPSLSNDTNTFGNLPPLQFTRTAFQTRDSRLSGEDQTFEEISHEGGMGMNQHYIAPISSTNTSCYDQPQSFYPSSSGFRAPSYYQSQDTLWPGSQMSPQRLQYGQQLQPHLTADHRRRSESLQSARSQDLSVNKYDQRSYGPSSEQCDRISSLNVPKPQPTFLWEGAAAGRNTHAARPRAMSDTFAGYHNSQ